MSKALNELKKATMASYLSKAGGRVRSATKIAGDFEDDHYKAMATANKHHPNMVTPGFEKDPEKLKKAENQMKVTGDLRDTFKRDAYNRIKGIALAGRRLAKEEAINERNTESHPSLWDTHELRHESGKALKKGDVIKDFRGDKHKIKGFELPHHSGSTGRVYTSQGSFFPGVVDAKIVRKKTVKEESDQKFKQPKRNPKDTDDQHLNKVFKKSLAFGKKLGKELKKEEVEEVNELKTSTLASVATKRFQQAQAALKDKDYGGYVKGMKKSQKAADATVPKSGWSPEDDKKNEEVVVESPQEKYRKIKEAKVKAACSCSKGK